MKLQSYRFVVFCLILLPWSVGCAQSGTEHSTSQAKDAEKPALNRLAHAKSPYLQEHADNPVDWHEWGDEALDKARREDKPLIISIGYSACHWCHVMERESFMDTAVARVMNDNFVSIKVDREERPDIDGIYLNAAQLLNGHAGWPLNAFALPDGRPFFAGTYFRRDQWISLLHQIADAYRNQKEDLVAQAESLTHGIAAQEVITVAPDTLAVFGRKAYASIFKGWEPSIDFKLGGWERTPKFMLPIGWEFALQTHYLTGNERALEAATVTLDHLARGGINDQLGGGFSRYSTDDHWLVPHFEKMLYDNAQLVSLYSHAYQVTGKPLYESTIRKTLDWVDRELTSPDGVFYSSINADSEGEEGKFYVWTWEELRNVLKPPTAGLVAAYYGVTESGNWEDGRNVLHRTQSMSDFAMKNGLTLTDWTRTLGAADAQLFAARERRTRPTTDDKVLTSWNALMVSGYTDAYHALGERRYLDKALNAARFLSENIHRDDGGLWRNFKDGEAGIPAFLDDYAFLATAYLDLYEATFDIEWLSRAEALTEYAVLHFSDSKSGMFYYTSDDQSDLIARKMEIADNVMPSSNSEMASVLDRLGQYLDRPKYTDRARGMVNHVANNLATGGAYYANWSLLSGRLAYGYVEIAVTGPDANTQSHLLQSRYLPTAMFMGGQSENLPLLQFKVIPGETIIYVCRDKVCELPVTDAKRALDQIAENSGVGVEGKR